MGIVIDFPALERRRQIVAATGAYQRMIENAQHVLVNRLFTRYPTIPVVELAPAIEAAKQALRDGKNYDEALAAAEAAIHQPDNAS